MSGHAVIVEGQRAGLAAEVAALTSPRSLSIDRRDGLDGPTIARVLAADLAVIDVSAAGFADAIAELPAASLRRTVVVCGDDTDLATLERLYRIGVGFCAIHPFHARELDSIVGAILEDLQRVVALGGGTGLYTLLTALRSIDRVHLTAVVSTSDDGGSSGVLRDELGVLPPGDVRRSLLALSNAPTLLRELMSFRFDRGRGLAGHNLGNLLLAGLSEITGSASAGFRAMGELLDINGVVLPVADELHRLVAEFEDGSIISGEHHIDVPDGRPITLRVRQISHDPPVRASLEALSAILGADLVTIGPGDLYTSVLANLTVGGVAEALSATSARVAYFCNLMTKPGETHGYTAADHVAAIVDHIGDGCVDEVVVSRSALPSTIVARYLLEDQQPVIVDTERLQSVAPGVEVWEADIGSSTVLARHSLPKLASLVADMLAMA